MRNLNNLNEEDNDYNYSPNELAELSRDNSKLYREIVESNLDENDSVEDWEQRNLKRMQEFLRR